MTTTAPVQAERARLAALQRYQVLDSPGEEPFDRLVRLTARVMKAPAAAITLVDADRVWCKAQVGLARSHFPRDVSLCHRAIASRAAIYEVLDTQADATLAYTPLLDSSAGVRSYAGAVLVTPDGYRIGTLCILDQQPRPPLAPDQRATLVDLASTIMTELERRRERALREAAAARLALINEVLVHGGGATGFVAAIEAVITRLCRHTGAINGQLWTNGTGQDIRALAFATGGEVTAERRAAFFRLFASACRAGKRPMLPHDGRTMLLPEITAARAAKWPLLQAGYDRGMRACLLQPLSVGNERFGLVLAFDTPRQDLPAIAELVAEVGRAMRPLLLRKQAASRLELLNDVLKNMAGASGFRAAFEAVLDRLCRHLDALYGVMFDKLDDEEALRLVAARSGADAPANLTALLKTAFPLPAGQSILEPLMQSEGSHVVSPLTEDMAARHPLIRIGVTLGVRSLAARSFFAGSRRYVLCLGFGTERNDLSQVTDLLAEIGNAIRPALQRKQMEERLALLQAAVDATTDALVITKVPSAGQRDCTVLQINAAFARMTGFSVDDVIGHDLRFMQGPETDRATVARLREAVHANRPAREELLNYRHDGTSLWVELDIAPIADERGSITNWVGVLRDTTERRATHDALSRLAGALRDRTTELTDLARRARIGAWSWRADTRVIEWSDENYELFGVTRETFKPTLEGFFALLHPDDVPAARAAGRRAMRTGQEVHVEARIRQPAGRQRTIVWSASVHRTAEGRLSGMHGYCQDITERRETEAVLRHGEKLRAIGNLTGGIAHEFNNLLTVVQANLELALLARDPLTGARPELEAAQRAAQAGTALTRRLLTFTRAEPLRPEPTDLADLLRSLREMAARTLGARYRIAVQATAALPPVRVDRSQLESAVLNLMLNARDAMPNGGPIVIGTGRVEVPPGARGALAVLPAGSYVAVTVRDEGCGMPADIVAHAFDPFFTTKPAGTGTGLGLSMVLSFARQSGGTVLIDSAPGQGSAVQIVLPIG